MLPQAAPPGWRFPVKAYVLSVCRWNHAFKNQITTLQSQAKNRANPNRSEVQANLSLFLEAASGFYTQVGFRRVGIGQTTASAVQVVCLTAAPAVWSQLLQELCTVFNVDLPCRVKSSQLGIISNKQSSSSAIVTPQPSSCSYICQHCLVHLGDIGEKALMLCPVCSQVSALSGY